MLSKAPDQPNGNYIRAATAFWETYGRMGHEVKQANFLRKQCRDGHLSCLFNHPISAGDILCGRNYANTEQRPPGKSLPLPRSLGPRAGAAKSAPACFCTARGLRMAFPFCFIVEKEYFLNYENDMKSKYQHPQVKFHWHRALLMHLYINCGGFLTTMAELSHCDRDLACPALHAHCLAF